MLAKQETTMKARRTVLGRVPARLKTRVIITRSMLVLLKAEEMVKPPIRSMIVGENMMEKTYLYGDVTWRVSDSEQNLLCCVRCGHWSSIVVANDAKQY